MILDEIVEAKREALADSKRQVSPDMLQQRIAARRPPCDLIAALRGQRARLIAEVKRASPSRGVLLDDFDPVRLALTYARSGAAAISVLTEERYFGGSTAHLSAIRQRLDEARHKDMPLLRKDFIFDTYQVHESRACGADALLLIAAILDDGQLAELLETSHRLGMSCLVEAHDREEVRRAVDSGAQLIGINNRNLKTFEVDIETSLRLRPLVPGDRLVVSESGIRHRSDVDLLSAAGVSAVLVGEALVTADDVAGRVREMA